MGVRLLIAFGVLAVGLAADVAPPPRPATRYVEELVRLLDSDEFSERERATRELSALDVAAPPPALLLALKSPEPEVRTRAASAAAAIRRRAELRELGRPAAFAKTGRVDLFVASTAAWDLPADDVRIWQTVLDVATGLDRRAGYHWRIAGKRASVTPNQFWLVSHKPGFVRSASPFEVPVKNAVDANWPGGVLAPSVTASLSLDRVLIVSRGRVRCPERIGGSVILANGDVSSRFGLGLSVVVSDGDVEISGNASESVVVARGNIRVGSASRATLIAGGKVTIEYEQNPRRGGGLMLPVTKESERHPLGFVTFFELSRVGFEVDVADKVVGVKSVADGKAFALAGAKAGDVVEGVNGAKPESAESLRRLLRDALAVGDATVTVRRGNAVHALRVTLPD